jgi:hypothetical protein
MSGGAPLKPYRCGEFGLLVLLGEFSTVGNRRRGLADGERTQSLPSAFALASVIAIQFSKRS